MKYLCSYFFNLYIFNNDMLAIIVKTKNINSIDYSGHTAFLWLNRLINRLITERC